MKYEKLFSPMKINQIEIKNRVVMTAMGVDVSNHDGTASDRTVAYYAERAKGGVGLIITEYTRVNEKDGVVAPGQLAMSKDRHIAPFKKVTDAVHAEDAKIFVQLHHPGRQNVVLFPTIWNASEKIAKVVPSYWKLYEKLAGGGNADSMNDPKMIKMMNTFMMPLRAPSNVPAGLGLSVFGNQRIKPFETEEIEALVIEFVDAAERAKKAGADGVELHAGHGYLIQQFLSPYTNLRTDKYGGSFENRLRFAAEIIDGIHQRCGADFPVCVRLSVNEFYDMIGYENQGIKLEEGVKIAKALEEAGADAINVTVGTVDTHFTIQEPNRFPQGWRRDMVKAVTDAVNIPVIAVGVIRTPEMAEQFLEEGVQDFIGLARPLLADPYWAKKAENGEEDFIQHCIGCLWCNESYEQNLAAGKHISCSLNPRTCREVEYPREAKKNGNGRKILIIGAGAGGLTAARELAEREFEVIVLEKESSAGGQLKLAQAPPHKDRLAWCYQDLERQAKASGAKIIYNTTATKKLVESYHPYAVIVATGANAFVPKIPGADEDYVTTVTPILDGSVQYKDKKIAVVGSGMTGIETAQMLALDGNEITVIEMADKIAPGGFNIAIWDVMQDLDNGTTRFMPGRKLERIENHNLTLVQKNGVRETVYADVVVLSLGVRSHNIADELAGACDNIYTIGDAVKVGRLKDTIFDAFKLSRKIN